uniref:Uncharacterized protein n=1 Tax=Rhizochromulina marina TaxID=1034831 RepID=A0A7S2RQA2_9STRA|mmetsp:Transcript_19434/g.56652  ORF Transcript_19434/g.56652 Transcript_19434/m.56652 type:complete len:110 (+) Transcript_19434:89-418(+)
MMPLPSPAMAMEEDGLEVERSVPAAPVAVPAAVAEPLPPAPPLGALEDPPSTATPPEPQREHAQLPGLEDEAEQQQQQQEEEEEERALPGTRYPRLLYLWPHPKAQGKN